MKGIVKRIAVVAMAFLISLSGMSTLAFAGTNAEETNFEATNNVKQIEVGETFQVVFSLKNQATFETITGGISFNSDVLEIESITGASGQEDEFYLETTAGEQCSLTVQEGEGGKTVGMYRVNTSGETFKAGVVANITFKAKATGAANIKIFESTDGTDGKDADSVSPGWTVTAVNECSGTPQEVSAEAATTSSEGCVHHYYCSECDKYISSLDKHHDERSTSRSDFYYSKIDSITLSETSFYYTGKAIEPTVTVTDAGGNTLTKGTDYNVTYYNNTNIGTGTARISFINKYSGSVDRTFTILERTGNSVYYRTHVQTYGWQANVYDGATSGTSGESKRLEGIIIEKGEALEGFSGEIQYRTHIQTYGWESTWKSNGEMSGTSGESKRLEAIQIQLTGDLAENYDVYYRVHAQTYGWLGWAKNGQSSGTAGYAKRLEAIQIKLVKKGGSAPGSTSNHYKDANCGSGLVTYTTHVQSYGWQEYVSDGTMSGTSGESKRLEGIYIKMGIDGQEAGLSGGIRYRTHVQTYGWESTWKYDGEMSGTSGQSKRLEAIQIELTGTWASQYDVYYCVHAQTYGWLGWAKNGESAGTSGLAKRLEGIKIVLVEKGGAAPGSTDNHFIEG